MNILGISCFYHDSAVALLADGRISFAAQEERYSRLKNDSRFPLRALTDCLLSTGTTNLSHAAYYENPWRKFPRVLRMLMENAPRGLRSLSMATDRWFQQQLFLADTLSEAMGSWFQGELHCVEHHGAHAASAFYPSPFEEAAILTIDAVGEWASTTVGRGAGNRIEIHHDLSFPHSTGMLYSTFTSLLGFEVNEGEYKLMGLAPYGQPVYAKLIMERLVRMEESGAIALNMSYFDFVRGRTMAGRKLHRLFGDGIPRLKDEPIAQKHMDIAASIQTVCEEIVLRSARFAHQATGSRNLCLAGGVALNAVANGRLQREGPFDRVWIQPAAGDAGGALGAAYLVWHQHLGKPREPPTEDAQAGSLLGPRFSPTDVRALLQAMGARYVEIDSEHDLLQQVARLLASERIVGWFHGRMEYGPRALGNRSILADPRPADMQYRLNRSIKFRESFRPFAPAVLHDHAAHIFELPQSGLDSPYMLFVHRIRAEWRTSQTLQQAEACASANIMDRLATPRSSFQAVTHVDYSARVQTVDEARHGRFYRLLRAFHRTTGCPMLVNTSFNVKGEPIVCTPEDALHCFMKTDIDFLVIENCLLDKREQPAKLREYLMESF